MKAALTFALVAALAACHDSPTEPPGLPVDLLMVDGPVGAPSITSAYGAVIIVLNADSLALTPCPERRGTATIDGSTLLVTLTTTQFALTCEPSNLPPARPNLRLWIDAVPSGQYDVTMVHRLVPLQSAPSEQEVARGRVVVP
jgi:hypothetical protein